VQIEPENQFTRSPIVENHVIVVESKCSHCGFIILVTSLDDLLNEEEQHRTECSFHMRSV
jgi:hypothetical protein